mmetsp:Transcript_14760/g.12584  ORF Transcript_14760/g.12584 Transcript_14760/m.12584 type:complete len:120 (-) Transcript_14760:285-644(-)
MSSTASELELDLAALMEATESEITEMSSDRSNKDEIIVRLKKNIHDIEQKLKKMEIEIGPQKDNTSNEAQELIKKFKKEYDAKKKKFMRLEERYIEKKNKEFLKATAFKENLFTGDLEG